MINIAEVPALRIMLMDDHLLFCEGIKEIIEKLLPNCVFSYCTNTKKAKEILDQQTHQFFLSDLLIPGEYTKEFISFCKATYPELSIIILSSITDINTIKECFALGINGYISKAVGHYELTTALQNVYNGDKYISTDLSGRVATSFFEAEKKNLTKKELEVLRLVAAGNTVNMIAETLLISPHTVMAHRRNIMGKLDLHSGAELVKYAFENKLF